MSEPQRDESPEARYLRERRDRLTRLVGAPLRTPKGPPTTPETARFLREEAEELYWNELAWEKLTDEEMIGGSELVEYTFPAFLAFIDGLLLREVPVDSPAGAEPRPDVVEESLLFLAGRCLSEDDEEIGALERDMTSRLMDLVLYRLHGVETAGVNRLLLASSDEDD